MNFASDNAAAVAPEIMAAIAAANQGYALAYGNDQATRRVEVLFSEMFEREVAVFLVSTGTAANALALAHVTPPWGAVLCHAQSHITTDECGAPEFFGGGLKLVGLQGEAGKIDAATVSAAIARLSGHRPHQVNAATLSLTQATEAGTIYRPAEISVLADIAHRGGLKVHMDGARFANALVRTNMSPAALTWRAGVDVLSLGATKGGALAAEAVIVFDPALAAMLPERRKRSGHLLSKHRFIAAQFEAFFRDDLWRVLARRANAMADLLAAGLAARGIAPVWPVEANLVFVAITEHRHRRLQDAGATYYVRNHDGMPANVIDGGAMLARLVTSFSTTKSDIDRFVAIAGAS